MGCSHRAKRGAAEFTANAGPGLALVRALRNLNRRPERPGAVEGPVLRIPDQTLPGLHQLNWHRSGGPDRGVLRFLRQRQGPSVLPRRFDGVLPPRPRTFTCSSAALFGFELLRGAAGNAIYLLVELAARAERGRETRPLGQTIRRVGGTVGLAAATVDRVEFRAYRQRRQNVAGGRNFRAATVSWLGGIRRPASGVRLPA